MQEGLEFNSAALGVLGIKVVDAVACILPRRADCYVLQFFVHLVDIVAVILEEGEECVEVCLRLGVESDEQIIVSEDAYVGLFQPDTHTDSFQVKLPDSVQLRGSQKDNAGHAASLSVDSVTSALLFGKSNACLFHQA